MVWVKLVAMENRIKPGAEVLVRAATGDVLSKRAVTGVVDGYDFPVVWACREEEWNAAQRDGREPDALPWPAEDVTPLVPA